MLLETHPKCIDPTTKIIHFPRRQQPFTSNKKEDVRLALSLPFSVSCAHLALAHSVCTRATAKKYIIWKCLSSPSVTGSCGLSAVLESPIVGIHLIAKVRGGLGRVRDVVRWGFVVVVGLRDPVAYVYEYDQLVVLTIGYTGFQLTAFFQYVVTISLFVFKRCDRMITPQI